MPSFGLAREAPARIRGSVLVLLLLGVALMLPTQEGRAQVREATLAELTEASTAVVLGRAVEKRSFWNEQETKIYTEVRLQVEEDVKGGGTAEVVVTIPGGRVGNTLYEVSDMPVFVEGEEVLVFLWQHPSGKHLVTGAAQGKLRVLEDLQRGTRVVPGAPRLLQQRIAPGGAAPGQDEPVPRGMLLENVIQEIKLHVRE